METGRVCYPMTLRGYSHLRAVVLAGGLRTGVRRRRVRFLRQGVFRRRRHDERPDQRMVLPVRFRRHRRHHHIRGRGRAVQLRRLSVLQRHRIG